MAVFIFPLMGLVVGLLLLHRHLTMTHDQSWRVSICAILPVALIFIGAITLSPVEYRKIDCILFLWGLLFAVLYTCVTKLTGRRNKRLASTQVES